MIGPQLRRLAPLVVLVLVATSLPVILAYDGSATGHDVDLRVRDVAVFEAEVFPPGDRNTTNTSLDDWESDRVDFLETGANPDVTVAVRLAAEGDDTAQEISVFLETDAEVPRTCWNYEEEPGATWVATVSGVNTSGLSTPGSVDLTAHVNDASSDSAAECDYDEWGGEENLGLGDDGNNQQTHTVWHSEKPDLTAPSPVAWCWFEGDRPGDPHDGDTGLCPPGEAVNATNTSVARPSEGQANATYFRIRLENPDHPGTYQQAASNHDGDGPELWEGEANGTGDGATPSDTYARWDGLEDPNATGSALTHEVDVQLVHLESGETWDLSRSHAADTPPPVDYLGNVSSDAFDLSSASDGSPPPAGDYQVELAVDEPRDRIHELDETNNTKTFDFTLFGPDVTPDINDSEIRTEPDQAYKYQQGNRTIHVNVTIQNVGDRLAFANETEEWLWEAQLNKGVENPRRKVLAPGTPIERTINRNLSPDDALYRELEIQFCQDTSQPCGLAPGEHTLDISLDTRDTDRGDLNEEAETNNADSVTFYLEDDEAPTVESRSPADGELVRVGEDASFSADIHEEDPNFGNVTLHLDPPGNASLVNESMSATQGSEAPSWTFTKEVSGLETEGTYTWWVSGSDPSGNTFTTETDLRTFEVKEWPKNVFTHNPEDGQSFPWKPSGTSHTKVRFNATINGTGQDHLPQGKRLNLTNPYGDFVASIEVSNGTAGEACPADTDGDECYVTEYTFPHPTRTPDEGSVPGRWNLTWSVNDTAGVTAEEAFHIRIQDKVPEINGSATTVTTEAGDGQVVAGDPVTLETEVRDPDGHLYPGDIEVGPDAAAVNFSHARGHANVSLDLQDGNETESTWAKDIPTGRNGALKWAGTYTYTVHARDVPRNWVEKSSDHENVTTSTVHVSDNENPDIVDHGDGVDAEEETNVPITFFAEVQDDTALTRVDVSIEVPADSDFCDPASDTRTTCSFSLDRVKQTDRYQAKVSFAEPGTYRWEVVVEDSGGNGASTSEDVLEIRSNLPPLVDVVVPEADDPDRQNTFFTTPTPKVILSITDPSGVDKDSITLTVDGNEISHDAFENLEPVPSPPNVRPGYNLSYKFANLYNDTDRIPVSVSATDKSPENKSQPVDMTLIVDARDPQSRIQSFRPASRAGGGTIWNISSQTTFNITASDPAPPDEPSSGVAEIRYSISKESQGQAITYDGPFKINESTPGWTGPGLYDLTYWAVDRVGNEEPMKTKSFNLDLNGPKFFYNASSRFVNVTVFDPHGVEKVTLHYKRLEEETFQTQEMTGTAGIYRGELPDLPRGEFLEYFITATDGLGNQAIQLSRDGDPYVFEAGNHPPTVSWVTPSDGATLTGDTTFRWEASDADPGEDLSYDLEHKLVDAGAGAWEEVTPVSGTSLTYDTSQIPDGTYDLRVVVTDSGDRSDEDVVTVTFDNADEAATPNDLPDTSFTLGEPVTFTTEVNKAAQSVVVVVTRDGEEAARIPMRDDGRTPDAQAGDNIYSARGQFNESGEYSWYVEVQYEENGQVVTEESDAGQSFTVEATASQVFERNLGLWIAIVVLTAAAAGLGWYALRNSEQGP